MNCIPEELQRGAAEVVQTAIKRMQQRQRLPDGPTTPRATTLPSGQIYMGIRTTDSLFISENISL